jgi:hypothetical protein
MSASEEKSGVGGFKVSDRRSFTEEGEPRPPSAEAPEPATAAAPEPAAAAAPGEPSSRALPPVDFHTFVISLGSSALLHLGEIESPDEGGPRQDLVMAKHTIDILEMLQKKTQGNLTGHEDKLLSSLLYDLRLRYVGASKKPT